MPIKLSLNKNIIKRSLIIVAPVLLVSSGLFLWYVSSQRKNAPNGPVKTQAGQEQMSGVSDNTDKNVAGGEIDDAKQTPSKDNQQPPYQGAPSKQATATNISPSKNPVVYTSYGHSQDKPIASGQLVATSCTTEANIDCKLVFSSSSKTVEFDAKTTDSNGVAIWNWKGGVDVPSGTWTVTATAGSKKSDPEVIYVQ